MARSKSLCNLEVKVVPLLRNVVTSAGLHVQAIVGKNARHQHALRDCEGIPDVVGLLEGCPDRAAPTGAAENAARLLYCLACFRASHADMQAAGAIDALVPHLAAEDMTLKMNAVWAIQSMSGENVLMMSTCLLAMLNLTLLMHLKLSGLCYALELYEKRDHSLTIVRGNAECKQGLEALSEFLLWFLQPAALRQRRAFVRPAAFPRCWSCCERSRQSGEPRRRPALTRPGSLIWSCWSRLSSHCLIWLLAMRATSVRLPVLEASQCLCSSLLCRYASNFLLFKFTFGAPGLISGLPNAIKKTHLPWLYL